MAENCITLEIVTPEGTSFQEKISGFTAHATSGSIGILKNHAPLITPLTSGPVEYVTDGVRKTVTIGDGFMRVENNVITLLVKSLTQT